MLLKWFLIFLLMIKVNCEVSPCPNIFNYVFNGNQWYGIIKIPSSYFGSSISLIVEMSVRSHLPFTYTGKIEVLGDKNDIFQNMAKGGLITYKIHFPVTNPPPSLTSIFINKVRYCSGDPARISENMPYISTVQLHHTLRMPLFYYVNRVPNVNIDPRFSYEKRNENYNKITKEASRTPAFSFHRDFGRIKELTNTQRSTTISTETIPTLPFQSTESIILKRKEELRFSRIDEFRCGVSVNKNSNPLIINGGNTEPGEWPWLVALFVNKIHGSLHYICSGSLISKTHIVTAAHCVFESNRKESKIAGIVPMLGTYNLSNWTDPYRKIGKVEKIHVHPEYNEKYQNDIAILEISEVDYSDYIRPICLWRGESSLSKVVNIDGTVVGWGKDENINLVVPSPKKATVRIVSTDTCRNEFPLLIKYTTNKTICADNKNKSGPCNGDSGGGLYIYRENSWMLRGIISNTLVGECFNQRYVIYTDTAQYKDWIKNISSVE